MSRRYFLAALVPAAALLGIARVHSACDDDVRQPRRDPEPDATVAVDAGDAGEPPEVNCELIDSGLPPGSFDLTYVNGHKTFPKAVAGDAGPPAIFTTKTAAVDRGGRVWIIGTADRCASAAALNDMAIMRLDVLGNVDLFFGGGTGYRCYDFAGAKESPTTAIFDLEDRLLIGGSIVGKPFLARLTDDGVLDPKFGSGGVVTDFFPGPGNPTVYGITVDGEGIVVSGGDFEPERDSTKGFVAHLETNGAADAEWNNGTGIYVKPDIRGFRAGHVRTPDGKVLTAGAVGLDAWNLVSLSKTGTEVGVTPGKAITGAGTSENPQAIALARTLPTETGNVVLVAGSTGGTPPTAVVGRFIDDPKGTAQGTFSTGTAAIIPTLRWDLTANFHALVRQCDGKGVVVGANGTPLRPSVARFDEITGQLDPSYGTGGTVAINAVDAGAAINVGYGALLLDAHNHVLVVAGSSQKNGPFVYRLNP
jgi:hypothetical protein